MKRLLVKRLLVGVAALLVVGAGTLTSVWVDLAGRDAVDRLEPIKQKVRADFPDVPQLAVDELVLRLDDGEVPLLLDVREPEEYAVSHLPGAVHVDPKTAADPSASLPDDLEQAITEAVAANRPIVAYCSVGYRSSQLAAALRDRGVEVVNLEGSIFEWAARGGSLVGPDGEPTDVVHPYSPAWAWLVDEDLRAYEPSGAGSSGPGSSGPGSPK